MGITNSATGILSGSAGGSLPYFIEGEINLDTSSKKLVPSIKSNISREIQIFNAGIHSAYILWSEISGFKKKLESGEFYFDTTCGHELWGKSELGTKLEISLRQNKAIDYSIGSTGEELMIPVKVRLAIGTGANYVDINEGSYDSDTDQYLINLQKLKNSDSGITGYKMFDIYSFYPGRGVTFAVVNDNPGKYENIALQLFDPLSVGEVFFALANDAINLELNNMGDKFVGNLTRNSGYKDITNNIVEVFPDYSKHIGRFVAQNTNNNNAYDTVIIKNYTPNVDPLLGGIFTLTGDF